MYSKDWIVYCNPPFKNADSVIEYLGRYTHRVAISNSRILNIDNNKVTFKWRDYRDKNKMKTMVLIPYSLKNCLFIGEGVSMSILLKIHRNFNL